MKRNPGKVYLVGAGPGCADLLTLRAVKVLQRADVILYDRLIAPEVLRRHAPKAKLIYVGKKASYHTLPQDDIENLLVNLARQGKTVARLKGGDPFIFGRGGEEAERLAAAHINFEVVPGISSAFAAPLFAGIPLTHRQFTPEIAIVTGHENPDKPGEIPYKSGLERQASGWIDWPVLANMGTIVFLMGMGNLSANMRKLVEHGKDPQTPVAIVRWGGLAKQRTVRGTVADIAEISLLAGMKAPAVIVVGGVAGMADKLNWLEKKPLFGKTIVITRATADNVILRERLEEEGASVIEWPLFKYVAIKPDARAEREFKRVAKYAWLVFTSARAVEFFRKAYGKFHQDWRPLMHVKIAAVGKVTAKAVCNAGLWVDAIPKTATALSLAKIFGKARPRKILHPCAADARQELPKALAGRHKLVQVVVYRKKAVPHTESERFELIGKPIDWVILFSPAAVAKWGTATTPTIRYAAIGPATAAAMRSSGITVDVVAMAGFAEDLVARIISADQQSRPQDVIERNNPNYFCTTPQPRNSVATR